MGYSVTFGSLSSANGGELDAMFNQAGLLGTIPCLVSGTNALTMTPYTFGGSPSVGTPPLVLQPQLRIGGIGAASNTGAVTATAGGLSVIAVYKDTPSGPAGLTGGEIVAGNYFVLAFDPALNGGLGGWHLENATASAAGTVTSVATGTGLTGGPISTTGTISLASIAATRLMANITGGAAAPIANTLTAVLDALLSSTQGAVPVRGASVWAGNTETSWSPAVAFGGSSAGITYGTQVGQFYQLGFLVVAMFNVILTSKGAQTGTATLSTPAASGGSNRVGSVMITNYNNLGSVASQPFGNIAASGSVATLYKAGTGTNAALIDTDFSNTTTLAGFMFLLTG